MGIAMFAAIIWIESKVPFISKRELTQLQERRRTAERSVVDQLQTKQKLDLRVSVLGVDYDPSKSELAVHLQFLNGGTAQRTILSVTFGYRDPDRVWKRSWEFLAPIPGVLGDVKPIRLAADSEYVETFRAWCRPSVSAKSGRNNWFVNKRDRP